MKFIKFYLFEKIKLNYYFIIMYTKLKKLILIIFINELLDKNVFNNKKEFLKLPGIRVQLCHGMASCLPRFQASLGGTSPFHAIPWSKNVLRYFPVCNQHVPYSVAALEPAPTREDLT